MAMPDRLLSTLQRLPHLKRLSLIHFEPFAQVFPDSPSFSFDELPSVEWLDCSPSSTVRQALSRGAKHLKRMSIVLDHNIEIDIPWKTLDSVDLRGKAPSPGQLFELIERAQLPDGNGTATIPLQRFKLRMPFARSTDELQWRHVVTFLSRLASLAPNLRHLSIGRFHAFRCKPSRFKTLQLPAVTTLVLEGHIMHNPQPTGHVGGTSEHPFADFLRFLRAFPALTTLVLSPDVLATSDLIRSVDEYARDDAHLAVWVPHIYALLAVLRGTEVRTLCVREENTSVRIEVRWERRTAEEEFVRTRYTID